jgi:hypothetical protein
MAPNIILLGNLIGGWQEWQNAAGPRFTTIRLPSKRHIASQETVSTNQE